MKYLPYLRIVLIVLGVILFALAITGVMEIDSVLYLSYVMFFATIGLAVLMPLIGIVQNPVGAVKSLVGLGIMAVVVGVAYAMSSDAVVKLSNGTLIDSTFVLRFTDTALFTTFFAFAGVIIAIVGSEFYRIFK